MSATAIRLTPELHHDKRPVIAAILAGLSLAVIVGKTLPVTAAWPGNEPLCAVSDSSGKSFAETVEPVTSHTLPNVPGKRVTIVRVIYGPGGFSRPHQHA